MVDIFHIKELFKETIVQLIEIERDKINFFGSFILPLATGVLAVGLTSDYHLLTSQMNYALIAIGISLIIVVLMLRIQSLKRIKEYIFFLKK